MGILIGMTLACAIILFFVWRTHQMHYRFYMEVTEMTKSGTGLSTYFGHLGDAGTILHEAYQDKLKSLRQLRTIMDELDDLVLVIDGDSNIVFANHRVQQWLEHEEKNRTEDGLLILVHRLLHQGECWDREPHTLYLGEESHLFEIKTRFVNLNREHGRCLVLVAGAVKDHRLIKDHILATEKLVAAGQLAAETVHEIRNPLTAIRGYGQLIAHKNHIDPFIAQYANYMIEEVDRLEGIVSGLLSVAQPRVGVWEYVDISEVLVHSIRIVSPKAVYLGIRIANYARGLPAVKGVPSKLQQLFTNLLLNSIQAMPEGGCITIRSQVCPMTHHVKISIDDTGCGIPEYLLGKIFDPFFTTKDEGTGLGLVVANNVVTEHDGFIEVDSQVGKGTTFTVSLPIVTMQFQKDFNY